MNIDPAQSSAVQRVLLNDVDRLCVPRHRRVRERFQQGEDLYAVLQTAT